MGGRLVFLRRQITELVVGGSAGLFHHAEGADQVGVVIDADARDVEVVERALGLDAVVAGGRDLHLAQAVMLAAGGCPPKPRKLRLASARRAAARSRVI